MAPKEIPWYASAGLYSSLQGALVLAAAPGIVVGDPAAVGLVPEQAAPLRCGHLVEALGC